MTSVDLKQAIEQLMSANDSDRSPEGFWYPLARPSFGPEEVLEAIESMTSYRTTMWEKTRKFEETFSKFVGAEAVMVNSGSSADLLLVYSLLESTGGTLRPGDEVLVPAVTWPTQLWSVAMAGLTPVLVDIDPNTLNMSGESIRSKITSRTKAIFVVHLMGNPANLDDIFRIADEFGLYVLEDCCESLGAQWSNHHVGSQSYGGTFSFFFSHHICTMEGGMIIARDAEVAERLRLLRAHGWARNLKNRSHPLLELTKDSSLDPRYTFLEWGFNVRPTELQAGFGLHQLRKFPEFMRNREFTYSYVRNSLSDLEPLIRMPKVETQANPCWFALPFMLQPEYPHERNSVTAKLQSQGIETRPIVAGNLARQPVRRRFEWLRNDDLPGATMIHERGFYIGLHSKSSADENSRLLDCLRTALD